MHAARLSSACLEEMERRNYGLRSAPGEALLQASDAPSGSSQGSAGAESAGGSQGLDASHALLHQP